MSIIFTNLTHRANTTVINNYSVRTKGRRFCADTCLAGSSPLSHLDEWERSRDGPNRRNVAEDAPTTFYRSLFAFVLANLRFGKMSRWGDGRSRKFSAMGNLSIELSKKGFETVDLLSGFVKPDGSAMDLSNRLSPEFAPKSKLLSDRAKSLAKNRLSLLPIS